MVELCSIKSGKSDTKDADSDGPYAFFDRSRTVKRSSRFLYDCEALIVPGEGAEFLPRRFVGRFDLHQRAYALYGFDSRIDVGFLYYYLYHRRDYFPSVAVGTTVKSLRLRHFEQLPVVLPPIADQQRIVAILDRAVASIATAKSDTERCLQNARAIFESGLEEAFIRPAGSWNETPLVLLCDPQRPITYGVIKAGKQVVDGVPYLRTSNVRRLYIETEGMRLIPDALSAEYSRTILRGGEVLVNVRGTLGGVAVVEPGMAGWNVSREIAVVPVDPRTMTPEFLAYFIAAGVSQSWLAEVKKGAAFVGINIEDLRRLPVGVPSPAT